MSISDRLDEIEARLNYEGVMDEEADYRALCEDAPAMLAALRAVLAACDTYEKTQAAYRVEMGQREIIRVVRAEIATALREGQ